MKLEKSEPRAQEELMPEGEHVLELKKVSRLEQPGYEDPTQMVDRLVWEFWNPDGYRHSEWTGVKYGNEKAKLTILLNRLEPEMNDELFEDFDTDYLIGEKFTGIIEHRVSAKGVPFSFLAFIKPLTAEAPPPRPSLLPRRQTAPQPAAAVAPPPAPAPAVPGAAAARVNDIKGQLMELGWDKKAATALLKAKIGDVNNADGIEFAEGCARNLMAMYTELVQRGHTPGAACGHVRTECPDPFDGEALLALEEKIRLRAFDLELEGASPVVDEGYVDPFADAVEAA